MEKLVPLYKQIKLTNIEEEALIKDYQANPSSNQRALEKLINANIGLAFAFINDYHINANSDDVNDMQQVAAQAIMAAVKSFKLSSGNRLSTYAKYKVDEMLTEYVFSHKNTIRLPKHMQTKLFMINRLVKANPSITDSEICLKAGITKDNLYSLRNATATVSRLNQVVDTESADSDEKVDFIKSHYADENPLDDMIADERMREYQGICKKILTPGEYEAFVRANGLFGHEKERVIDIAASKGLENHTSISNMLRRAVNKLKNSELIGELSHRF